jgi:hypothetical protein
VQHVGDVADELPRQRQVEPVFVAQRLHLLDRRVLAGEHPGRVGGNDVGDREDDERQPQQRRRHPQDAAQRKRDQPHGGAFDGQASQGSSQGSQRDGEAARREL